MGLFRRGESTERPPKEIRWEVRSMAKALESVRMNTTKQDLSISVDGMSLASAADDSSRLISPTRYHDGDSMARIKRLAPIWTSIARAFEERTMLERMVQELDSHGAVSRNADIQAIVEDARKRWAESLMQNLRKLRDELES